MVSIDSEISMSRSAATWLVRSRQGALLFVFWTLIGLSFAGQFYISSSQLGRPISWHQALSYSLADWYVFALLSFIPVMLARQLNLEGTTWVRHLAIHLAASAFFSLAYVAIRAGVGLWQGSPDGRVLSLRNTLPPLFYKTWHFNLLIYWVIVSVTHAVEYYRKFQERHLRAAELERRLVESRLQALQMQLNPHFLFNSLHAIAELMHRDVDAADRMLTRLSELLRIALDSTHTQTVTLRSEVEFLRRYLEIEQTRFGDRLRVEFHIPDDTLEASVPNLILQPLIENAIKHGIEPNARVGMIHIRARRQGTALELTVDDNGRGLAKEKPQLDGIGLSNTRARLHQLYGNQQTFTLEQSSLGGTCARVIVPWAGSKVAA